MTRHPLLWITAAAMAVGAGTWATAPIGAQSPLGWDVTIDVDAVVASHEVVVQGRAAPPPLVDTTSVTVTLTPDEVLPERCTAPLPVTVVPSGDDAYEATVTVPCNGPYRVSAVARGTNRLVGRQETSPAATGAVGVAEAPPQPGKPRAGSSPGGGLTVSWDPNDDLDAAGWILLTSGGDQPYPATQHSAALGPELRGSTLAIRAVRWGAAGPDGEKLMSPDSSRIDVDLRDPNPPDPPAQAPPAKSPGPGGAGPGRPSSANPPPTGRRTPTPSTGSTATLPDGYTEELPYGVPDEAFVPSQEPPRTAASDGDESTAAARSRAAGLVRTSEKRSPGLVAPFALGLLMITIAAHIAWYLRRSKPPSGGQVSLG